MKTKIWVRFGQVGFHSWPLAPQAVSYLRQVHRHLFNFKVSIEVPHPDRALEFHTFGEDVKTLHNNIFDDSKTGVVETAAVDYYNMSCETIAETLLLAIKEVYPSRAIDVEVSEDDENGATVSYSPDED